MTIQLTRRNAIKATASGFLFLQFPGFAKAADAQANGKTLVVLYSRTGNTARLAERIVEKTQADFLRLEVKVPYAAQYNDMTYIARDEKRRKARREIATEIPDLSAYSTVFICTPYWWGGMSVPMYTFLSDHPMQGKRVIPCITSGSSDPEGALDEMRELMPQAKFEEHFYTPGSSAATAGPELDAWLKRLGF